MSTDSFVVRPLFFPGGNIGELAVNGTVNDIAMSGATPLYLSAGFIIEEGLPLATLGTIVSSMAAAAQKAGVQLITGDTKVVCSIWVQCPQRPKTCRRESSMSCRKR